MLTLDHTRHSGIFNAKDWSVVLVGAGGIGAITGITLGKMGVGYLEIWDGDVVDGVNIATQYHMGTLLGTNKATALSQMMLELAPGVETFTHPQNIGPNDKILANIVISALDSIKARKDVMSALFNEESDWSWYIDAGMGAEELVIYTAQRDEFDWYENRLNSLDEEDIAELPCTEKATIYTANGAAAFIGATVRRIVSHMPVPKIQAVNFKEGRMANV